MNATIHPLPDAVSGFAQARAVIDAETDHGLGIDSDALEAAAEVLDASEWCEDVNRRRKARNIVRERQEEAKRAEATELAARMAQHFEALRPARKPLTERQKHRLFFLFACVAMLFAMLAHLAMAAPGKIARTVELHHQIMEASR